MTLVTRVSIRNLKYTKHELFKQGIEHAQYLLDNTASLFERRGPAGLWRLKYIFLMKLGDAHLKCLHKNYDLIDTA